MAAKVMRTADAGIQASIPNIGRNHLGDQCNAACMHAVAGWLGSSFGWVLYGGQEEWIGVIGIRDG